MSKIIKELLEVASSNRCIKVVNFDKYYIKAFISGKTVEFVTRDADWGEVYVKVEGYCLMKLPKDFSFDFDNSEYAIEKLEELFEINGTKEVEILSDKEVLAKIRSIMVERGITSYSSKLVNAKVIMVENPDYMLIMESGKEIASFCVDRIVVNSVFTPIYFCLLKELKGYPDICLDKLLEIALNFTKIGLSKWYSRQTGISIVSDTMSNVIVLKGNDVIAIWQLSSCKPYAIRKLEDLEISLLETINNELVSDIDWKERW